VDHMSWASDQPTGAFEVLPPASVTEAIDTIPEGALLELPVDSHTGALAASYEDLSLLWHQTHRRGTSETPSPGRSSAYDHSVIASLLDRGQDPRGDPCAESETNRLRQAGFTGAILLSGRIDPNSRTVLERQVSSVLGRPTYQGDAATSWTIRSSDHAVEGTCQAPLSSSPGQSATHR
ncbi:MAG: hypothetical protein QGG40_15885, partial [Myxococcota bacterium]|nr:hypothetical protein [Myxococcota bacterium]